MTFDEIPKTIQEILYPYRELISRIQPVIVNRDLRGRVRLIVSSEVEQDYDALDGINTIAQNLEDRLGAYAYPASRGVLFENDVWFSVGDDLAFEFVGVEGAKMVDRLAANNRWACFSPIVRHVNRIVFFSIQSDFWRSKNLLMSSDLLASFGKRVLLVDLDLEAPKSADEIIKMQFGPECGVTDWLMEDLVDNGDAVFGRMAQPEDHYPQGGVCLVPAAGDEPGNYIAKISRAWLPKIDEEGNRESWAQRVNRLLAQLERRWNPDVTLINSPAGINDAASICIGGLGAGLVFLLDYGERSDISYKALFDYWADAGFYHLIKDRLRFWTSDTIPERLLTETGVKTS